jgi:hypothetical protein
MAVLVTLDLSEPVSIRELRQFLSLAPQWYDIDKDLRSTDARGLHICSLVLDIGSEEETPPSSQAPTPVRPEKS